MKFYDDSGEAVKDIRLKAQGDNEISRRKSQEINDTSQLGPVVSGGNFAYSVNVIVDFTDDDNPENYKPDQTAFVISPKGENRDPNRPGRSDVHLTDNPEKNNVEIKTNQLICFDNPGLHTTGAPPASINCTYLAFFASTVKPKDEKAGKGQSTDKVMYWAVRLDVKNGKIVKAAASPVSKDFYYQQTKQKPPKENKN